MKHMSNISPKEVSSFISLIASKIDSSIKPKADLVVNDIKCTIAALNGDEKAAARIKAILASTPASAPVKREASTNSINLKFSGPLSKDLLSRAAAEIVKKRPTFEGREVDFVLTAKVK